MRLKFLFFPIMLVISVSLFIGYVWPEIQMVRGTLQKKADNALALQAIKDKQAAIDLVGTQIAKDSQGVLLVKSYLPEKQMEEQIISGVNYLATDAGVSLVNVSLKTTDDSQLATQSSGNATLSSGVASSSVAVNGQTPAKIANAIEYTEATISISGDYQKIHIFLDKVQKMSLFNMIKSLTISTQQANATTSTSGGSSNPATLSANMTVEFGYAKPLKIDDTQKISQFKSELDNQTIAALQQYISISSQGAQYTAIGGSQAKGKTNPFLP